jgi:hypothetical protein
MCARPVSVAQVKAKYLYAKDQSTLAPYFVWSRYLSGRIQALRWPTEKVRTDMVSDPVL